jgi:hypothetical protein
VGGGGELVDEVAQVEFDLSEGLVVGEIDQAFGQATEGQLGVGSEQVQEVLDAGFAVIGTRLCRGMRRG